MVKKKSLNTPWNIPCSRIGKFNSVQGQFFQIYQWLSAIPIEIQAELCFFGGNWKADSKICVEMERVILVQSQPWGKEMRLDELYYQI